MVERIVLALHCCRLLLLLLLLLLLHDYYCYCYRGVSTLLLRGEEQGKGGRETGPFYLIIG